MTHPDDRARRRAPLAPGPRDQGMDQGMTALSYLITGVVLWGGLGWVGDHFLQLEFLLPLGIVVGAGLGCYMIIARFGGLKSSKPPVGHDVAESAVAEQVVDQKESTWSR